MKTRKPTGYIAWQGPSRLDGAPITVVVLTDSTNRKTGNMVQTYIIRSDVHPVEAAKTGADASICGNCKHRPFNGGACYVNLGHGPSAVYKGLQRGIYPTLWESSIDAEWPSVRARLMMLGAGRMVRLGTYGDPLAVPAHVWKALIHDAIGSTGYTHQWDTTDGTSMEYRPFLMASADSEEERRNASVWGWRTFRVRAESEPVMAGEFICPASDEAGKRKTCHECGACDGAQRGAQKASPVIIAHGAKARRFIPITAAQ